MLTVNQVDKSYSSGGLFFSRNKQVLHHISFALEAGEVLGIIGESGSGKSTLGRLLLGIEKPDHGTIQFEGRDIGSGPAERERSVLYFKIIPLQSIPISLWRRHWRNRSKFKDVII